MKKILYILLLAFFCTGVNVSASEIYFSNVNGVNLTEEEYNFISKIFWDGYQKEMTIEDYNFILSDGISENIVTNNYIPYQTMGTTHTTASKSLTITKTQLSSYTLISVVATWLASPTVRSYDVIGSYLSGVSLMDAPTTKVSSSSGTTSYADVLYDNNGFGVSVKLPTSGSNIIVSQAFKVNGSGHIYSSYQHAKKSISLSNSKRYSISLSGYGNVFLFESSIKSYYDQMGGVDISI